ncbi:MAG: hypothetical protein WBV94_33045 [Blastocatellia bacterium]
MRVRLFTFALLFSLVSSGFATNKNSLSSSARKAASTNSASLARAVKNFERVIAEDTVRNEYRMHRQIHEWFVASVLTGDVDALNEKVYEELFLTPSSDRWLGLFPEESYTGIENDGVRK